MKGPSLASSPLRLARLAGAFYVVTIVAGVIGFTVPAAMVANAVAGLSYIGVTILFYYLFKPVNPRASLLAMSLSLAGIVCGPVAAALSLPHAFSIIMSFFGCYCLLIGYLAYGSGYLPRLLGLLLAIGGLGYLINSFANFLSLGFAPQLFPYVLLPGFMAETLLCLWLLAKGVDVPKWDEKVRLLTSRD